MTFTPVERAILDWFATHCPDAGIRAQLSVATPGGREETPVGFFTELALPPEYHNKSAALAERYVAFDGCALFAPELAIHADCLLHTSHGRLRTLEVYAIGDGHPARVTTFSVKTVSGNYVDLR